MNFIISLINNNFLISIVGWFLWNWAEYSIVKESGDGYIYKSKVGDIIRANTSISEIDKETIVLKINELFKKISLKDYAVTHYETWIGSFVTIILLLWIMSRQLSLDPLAPIIGTTGVPLGWNDLYLLCSGIAWDAFIFGFKYVKNYFRKKSLELKAS